MVKTLDALRRENRKLKRIERVRVRKAARRSEITEERARLLRDNLRLRAAPAIRVFKRITKGIKSGVRGVKEVKRKLRKTGQQFQEALPQQTRLRRVRKVRRIRKRRDNPFAASGAFGDVGRL